MGKRIDALVNALLLGAAVTVVMQGLRRPDPPTNGIAAARVQLSEADWSFARRSDVIAGSESAEVRLVVVTDFECPFCKDLHNRLSQRIATKPNAIALSILHYPLNTHRFAKLAAAAFECSGGPEAKRSAADLLYAKQDSIGLLDWAEIGRRLGIKDSTSYVSCVRGDTSRIMQQYRFAQSIGVTATPTVLANGYRLAGPPTDHQLDSLFAISKD